MKTKFYICRHCGNLVEMINSSGVPMICCGEKMEELRPNTTEASGEKHLPTVKVEGNVLTATVGSVEHPMDAAHYIEWIVVETENGVLRRDLKPGERPVATFDLGNDKALAVYAWCNMHGLWMTEVK